MQLSPDIIIAADGPFSPTAKAFGLYHPQRENCFGLQAIVKGKFSPNKYQTFFGSELGYFSWIVPESATTARVGLVAKNNVKLQFQRFLAEHKFKVEEVQAGHIPLYHPRQQLKKDNCYLLGDAAGFVKATTFGGIIPGLKQAEILAHSIIENKNYQHATKQLQRKLWLHLRLRKVFEKFSDDDWDSLVSLTAQEKVQIVLQQHTRENPLPILFKLARQEPRLLKFVKYLV